MRSLWLFPLTVISIILFTGCHAQGVTPVLQVSETPTLTSTPNPPTSTHTPTVTASPSATPTVTPSPSATVTATPTFTPSPIPTYTKLRAKVIIDQAVCHYGPGAPYLYKYGVYKGSNIEVLRRVIGSNYVEIQAIGGSNRCWVRADYLEFKGDWLTLEPVSAWDVKLPISPYYPSPGGVTAKREGNEIIVSWNPLLLRAGDDSEQTPYIIEAWICVHGEMIFKPFGTYQTSVRIPDEPGCSEASYATFIAAEKHGYTPRVEVPIPPHTP
ncbi:hypothetical protein [Anaerolinea thermophila]|uniref:SH3b domain-containing protein n=1 Tax=Anaerolinea thermophila (strain DSM 14523 / JCM 11388 / NBRC 100420 / UNI-1) TaxID=926569 RepID=E8N4C6_ANATU|nr:hypothetical protein [Anaerolinea thermophila]BAJ63290.1 hypothetical protein ANT_12560 [Anaerolinea thermophila UNI-1]